MSGPRSPKRALRCSALAQGVADDGCLEFQRWWMGERIDSGYDLRRSAPLPVSTAALKDAFGREPV